MLPAAGLVAMATLTAPAWGAAKLPVPELAPTTVPDAPASAPSPALASAIPAPV